MNKKKKFYFWHIALVSMALFILPGCGAEISINTPTPQWQRMPTYSYYVPPSDVSEYTHYIPSEVFDVHLEFDYPSYWWLKENIDETGILSILLGDPRFLTLPTPTDDFHPTPNNFGSVNIWIMPTQPGQTPDTELASHKEAYSETPRMKVLGEYKIVIDGREAGVLEYQVDDPETSTSLMFYRRTYFMVNGQIYEIIFSIADSDRGGEFEKGYEHLIKSLKIIP